MKKNIRILIIVTILGLIALSFIQGYLINNTYKLEKEVVIEETKQRISRFDDDLPIMDSIYDRMFSHVLVKISDYKLNRIGKSDILNDLKFTKDSVNQLFIDECQKEFKKRGVDFLLKYQKRLKSVIILDSIANDTLYYETNTPKKYHLLGDTFELGNHYKINNSQTRTNYETDYVEDGTTKYLSYDFQLVTEDFIDVDDWSRIILRRMTSILVLSILIFTLVLGLLYYSIKTLITQKKIAEVKTDFINNITHELKTPLATLSLATKMLKRDDIRSQSEAMDATVNTINRQSNRLQKLIDQVMNNSLGYKEIQLHKETIKADNYINSILDDFMLSVQDKEVNINRSIPKSNKDISVDKFYFTTAIFNILENAVKYNNDGVNISCDVNIDDHFTLSVSDDGIGIPEKHQSQLFEKFYRVGNTEIHDVKGLGLGLYYTNQIIKAHEGIITVKSKEGKGTTFIIQIPLN